VSQRGVKPKFGYEKVKYLMTCKCGNQWVEEEGYTYTETYRQMCVCCRKTGAIKTWRVIQPLALTVYLEEPL